MIYLAAPFGADNRALVDWRQEVINKLTTVLVGRGMPVFSPLTYSNILKWNMHPAPNEQFWYDFDLAILAKCSSMLLVKLPGWELSKGVNLELKFCFEHQIPVMSMDTGEAMLLTGMKQYEPPVQTPIVELVVPAAVPDDEMELPPVPPGKKRKPDTRRFNDLGNG